MLQVLFLQADFGLFIGRFHPLVVHLPIGFLILGGVLEWIKRKRDLEGWDGAVSFSLALGAIAGVVAAICGWLLAAEGGYQEEGLFWHRWLGIGTTVLAIITWGIKTGRIPLGPRSFFWGLGATLLGILFTGHLGGNLTHGEGYLYQHAPTFVQRVFGYEVDTLGSRSFASPDSILVYTDLIRPVLEKKCVSCHGDSKTQGGFSMATFAALLEGGDHGEVIEPESAFTSELIRRVTINPASSKYMPPKGNPLTFTEINLLSWWIDAGADSSLRLTETEVPESVKALLLRDYELDTRPKPYVETANPEPLPESAIAELESAGFSVQMLAATSNFVEIGPKTINATVSSDEVRALAGGKDQITWLNFGGADIKDEDLKVIGQLDQLTRLRLEKNPVTDAGLAHLTKLKHLESLNLYGTQITDAGLDVISALPALKKVYLWQTQVTPEGVESLRTKRPDLMIDTGFQFAEQNN